LKSENFAETTDFIVAMIAATSNKDSNKQRNKKPDQMTE
jgi:hypothetical protein